jgi:hypothetical protein
MPIIMLQQQTIMPFIIMQQLHIPPAIMVQRFCIIVADILSSHVQTIFMPPLHFSIFMVQRGTIVHCGAAGMAEAVPIPPDIIGFIPVIIPVRSIIMAVLIALSPGVSSLFLAGEGVRPFPPSCHDYRNFGPNCKGEIRIYRYHDHAHRDGRVSLRGNLTPLRKWSMTRG